MAPHDEHKSITAQKDNSEPELTAVVKKSEELVSIAGESESDTSSSGSDSDGLVEDHQIKLPHHGKPKKRLRRKCRICYSSDRKSHGWVAPCRCTGTLKYVHQNCLNEWRKGGFRSSAFHRCEICDTPYTIVYTRNHPFHIINQFLQYPGEVFSLSITFRPLIVMAAVMFVFLLFWTFWQLITYVGPLLVVQGILFSMEMISRGRLTARECVRRLGIGVSVCSVVLGCGFLGKLLLFVTMSPTVFYEYFDWKIDILHFFVSSLAAALGCFIVALWERVVLFYRRHSLEIVLDYEPNNN